MFGVQPWSRKVETHGKVLVFKIQAVEHKLSQWLGVGSRVSPSVKGNLVRLDRDS